MFKRIRSLALCYSFACAPIVAAGNKVDEAHSSLYDVIKQEYLPGLKIEAPAQPALDASGKPTAPVDLKVRHLSDDECKLLAFELLAHNNDLKDRGFLMKNTREDLELFKGSNVLQTIDRTRTAFGEAVLGTMLLNGSALSPVENQKIVRALVEDRVLFAKVDESIKNFAEAEKLFLTYYLPTDPAKENYFKDLYFNGWVGKKIFGNENSSTLNFFTHLDGFRNTSKLAVGGDLALALASSGVFGLIGYGMDAAAGRINPAVQIGMRRGGAEPFNCDPEANLGTTCAKVNFVGGFALLQLYDLAMRYFGFGGQLPTLNHMFLRNQNAPGYAYPLIAALYAWTWYQVGKEGYTNLNRQVDSTRYLQSHLIACGTAIRSLEQVASIAKQHGFDTAIPEIAEIGKLQTQNAQVAQLVNLLNTNTFKGSPSYFSNLGRVLVAHKLMAEHCRSLRNAFEAVGKLDAFLAAAKLYKDHLSMPVQYCFVNFELGASTPHLKLVNFWNPVLNPTHAVPNSIEFGAQGQHRNMILTGLNSAGKSTVIKGIVEAVLLAQIFGIAPAQEMKMTPFTSICTHIVVKDDVENGRSLFQVEVDQAKNMLTRVQSLRPNEFSLVIIDEMFRSTGPEHAQVHSYNYAKRIASYPNVILLESTHYPKLIGLEKETNGLFKNYKIEMFQNPDGTLRRPYKIEEGSTTSEMTAAIFAEQGLTF